MGSIQSLTSARDYEAIARELAAGFRVGAAARDRDRVPPLAELERIKASGLLLSLYTSDAADE